MNWSRLVGLWLVCGVVVVAACAPPPAPQSSVAGTEPVERPGPPKRMTAAIMSAPPTVSILISGGGGRAFGGDVVEELVNVGLTIGDHLGGHHPRLAEAVPSIENGLWRVFPDGRSETTWKINRNARWHDGTLFTSEDLLFTARVHQDKELPMFPDPAFDMIESIEAPDAHTVTVSWKLPFIAADSLFKTAPLPRHLLERVFVDNKASFLGLSYWTDDFVGTGPFKLRSWVSGSHVVLEANHTYVLGRPKLDEIEVKFIPDPNTIVANMLAGAVDAVLGRGISIEQAMYLRDQRRDVQMNVTFRNWIPLFAQFIDPNPPVASDVRFRRALYHALDRQQMADTFLPGIGQVAHSYVNPDEPQYKDIETSIVRYEYDPRRAVQMLEELGYARGPDGRLRDAMGEQLSVGVRAWPKDLNEKVLYAVTDSWERIGVAAQPEIIPSQRTRDIRYLATYPTFELAGVPNGFTRLTLHEPRPALPENNFIGGYHTRYRSAELDALVERYYMTIPKAERMQVLGQIVRHTTSQLNVMGLIYDPAPTVVSSRLANVSARGWISEVGWNGHEWAAK